MCLAALLVLIFVLLPSGTFATRCADPFGEDGRLVRGEFTGSALLGYCPLGDLSSEHVFGDYQVRLYEIQGETNDLEILKGDQPIYAMRGRFVKYSLADWYPGPAPTIAGDGEPDLVVSEDTGGNHCCTFYHIFEIGSYARSGPPLRRWDLSGSGRSDASARALGGRTE
jgi:hypothetical protein